MLTTIYNHLLIMSAVGGGLYLILKLFTRVTIKYFKCSWHYYSYIGIYMILVIPFYKLITVILFSFDINKEELFISNLSSIISLPINNQENILFTTTNLESYPTRVNFLPYIFLIGTLVFILTALIQNIRLRHRILGLCHQEEQFNEQFYKYKQEMKVSTPIQIYVSRCASSPFIYGYIKPRIILPNIKFKDEELRHIFQHELTHWKRRDSYLKLVMLVINAIHWFNPLVYLARVDIDRFCELSCDESVIASMNIEERRGYCELMLSVLWTIKEHNVQTFSAFSNKQKQLARRVDMIMNINKHNRKSLQVIATIITMVLMLFGSITAYAASEETPVKKINSITIEQTVVEGQLLSSSKTTGSETENTVNGTHTIAEKIDSSTISPQKIGQSSNFSLKVGKSYQTTFTMDGKGSSHNAFRSRITGVRGTYKYIVTGDNDYQFTSEEYNSDMSFKTTKANSGVKYTVTVVNTGAGTLSGKISINSYRE